MCIVCSSVLRWPRMGRTMTIWMEMIPGTLAPTGPHWPTLATTGHTGTTGHCGDNGWAVWCAAY